MPNALVGKLTIYEPSRDTSDSVEIGASAAVQHGTALSANRIPLID